MTIRKERKYYLIAAGALLILIGYLFWQNDKPTPKFPVISDRSGEMTAASELLNLQKAIGYYRFEIRQNPDVVKNYVQLAQLYLQQSRITGRHHEYVAQAQELLTQALTRDPDDFEAIVTKASVLLIYHRSEEAKVWAEKALAKGSFNAFAWGVLSDALKELGDYEGAVKACDKMLSIRPDLRSYARASHLREIHGDVVGARRAMKLAADAGVSGLEARAWALYHLGNLYLMTGKVDTAEVIYRGCLTERPGYAYALSGLAKIHLARKEYNEAVQKLLRAYELAPEHEFMEKLVEVYRTWGRTQLADNLASSVLDDFAQHERQGWNINLEYAGFCLDHNINLPDALDRITKEYRRRPKNIEVQETYAWALYKNGRIEAALPIIEAALRLQTRDASLFYKAAMIYHKLKRQQEAQHYFEQAISLNPYSPESEMAFRFLEEMKAAEQLAVK